MPSALLFDVGDVLMESNWVVLDELERRTGRRFTGRGARDPAGDPAWRRCLDGEIDIDEYWNQLAQSGGYADRITMWRAMSTELGGGVFADDALALVDEAQAAGVKVGILSNDLYRSSTREWVAGRPEFAKFDVLVDCTDFGERKPAPGPYLKAAADFGLAPEEIVFLDDTPYCIEGARAVGMVAVHVDPLARKSRLRTGPAAGRPRRSDDGRSTGRRRRGGVRRPGSLTDHGVDAPRHRHLLERPQGRRGPRRGQAVPCRAPRLRCSVAARLSTAKDASCRRWRHGLCRMGVELSHRRKVNWYAVEPESSGRCATGC